MTSLLRKAKKTLLRPVSLFTFSCIITIGTLLLYNLPFFQFVIDNSNESTLGVVWLTVSLVIIMLTLNFMMTYLTIFCLRIVGRILLAILSIINATAVYFVLTYNVIINATTIENVFNTRYSEASGFFSWSLWLFIIVFGVLPALFCLFQPVVIGKAKKLGIWCGSSLAVIVVIGLLNINQTLFFSEHDTELGGLLQPWSYIANTYRVISFMQDEQEEEILLPDGQITDNEKAVVVLVIGESARKANLPPIPPLAPRPSSSPRTAATSTSCCPTTPSALVSMCRGAPPTGASPPSISTNTSPTPSWATSTI